MTDLRNIENGSWTNGQSRYEDNKRYLGRLQYANQRINVPALQQRASSMRNGLPCEIHDKFSAGSFNLVRLLIFQDGVRWVARLRLPPIAAFDDNGHMMHADKLVWDERDAQALRSEVATMLFVKSQTSIPIPEVFDYDTRSTNPIGFSYVLMEYVDGMIAFDLAAAEGQPMRVPERYYDHYINQIAEIMNQLAQLRAPCIGSIVRTPMDSKLSEECMGPEAQTQAGPWRSLAEFYREYPLALLRRLHGDSEQLQANSGCAETVRKFTSMFGNYSPPPGEDAETDFGFVNLEMGTHNVIVDCEFNVLSVIDWDATFAAPRAVVHHFPWCIGADPGLPGGESRIFKPLPGQSEMTAAFCDAIVHKAVRLHTGYFPTVFTRREFFTKEALAFRAIAFVRADQNWVDSEWLAALEWLDRKSSNEVMDCYWTIIDYHHM